MRRLIRTLATIAVVPLLVATLGPTDALAAQGDLDDAFGIAGVVPLEWSLGPVANTRDIASTSDGRLYLAGDSGAIGCLTRLTSAGVVDTTFNGTGSVCDVAGGKNGPMRSVQVASDGSVVTALTVENGRRVVRLSATGTVLSSTLLSTIYPTGAVLDAARLSDGTLALLERRDLTTYAVVVLTSAGTFVREWVVPAPAGGTFAPLQLLPGLNGDLFLVGTGVLSATLRTVVGEFLTTGATVTTFDTDGYAVGAATDSTIGAVGARGGTGLLVASQLGDQATVTRYRLDGTPDPAFGTGGSITSAAGTSPAGVSDVVLRPDGRFYLAYSGQGRLVPVQLRLADGSPDTAFGPGGTSSWDAGSGQVRSDAHAALGPLGDLYVVSDNPSGHEEALRFDGTSDVSAPTGVGLTAPGTWTLGSSTYLDWTAADASGIGSFDVRTRRAGTGATLHGPYTTAFNGTTRRGTAVQRLLPGTTICASVRARDVWGLTSGWTGDRCTAVPLTPRQLVAGPGFRVKTASRTYSGRVLTATAKGASFSRRGVAAKRIALVATTCAACGSVAVYVGRTKVGSASLTSRRVHTRVVIAITTLASVRSGALTVVVTSRGKPVIIEGVGVSAA